MFKEIIVVGIIAIPIGAAIAFLLRNKIRTKQERSIQKIANDPELLLKKLKEHGEFVDMGERLEFVLEDRGGKKELVLKKLELNKGNVQT